MKLSPFILFRKEFDGTGVIFDPTDNKAFSLNKTATAICEMLQEGIAREEILGRLRKVSSGITEDAPAEINAFLDDMIRRKYLSEE